MPIRLEELALSLDRTEDALGALAAERLGIDAASVAAVRIVRRSIDARRKPKVVFRYAVEVTLVDPSAEVELIRRLSVQPVVAEPVEPLLRGTHPMRHRPVIVGTGPAGLFAGLLLAEEGYSPLLLERGQPVAQRADDHARFLSTRCVNPESNLLFGEGGAGTWSDGKLRTRTRSRWADWVLARLVQAGAPGDILYDARPHVGTDLLHHVIPRLRNRIESLGGEVRFGCRVEALERAGDAVRLASSGGPVVSETVIFAVGGSARDTFEAAAGGGVKLEAKPFQVGVRIEHPQELIDRAQFGSAAGHENLPKADYELVYRGRPPHEHPVHTFCMCPGGEIVPTVSEAGRLCVNGMSPRSRSGPFADGALVWTERIDDWAAGVAFQRGLEEQAFLLGGGDYAAPAQRVTDFLAGRPTTGELETSYRLGTRPTDLRKLFASEHLRSLASAIRFFGQRLSGFDGPRGVLVAIEARVSCPVRMTRDPDTRRSVSFPAIYPVGEGAGYAGGIMSAAVDGMETAARIVGTYACTS